MSDQILTLRFYTAKTKYLAIILLLRFYTAEIDYFSDSFTISSDRTTDVDQLMSDNNLFAE